MTMNFRKIWLIARREYLTNFRRRSYLFTAFGVPLLTIIILAVVFGLIQSAVEDISGFKAIGIVDNAGIFTDPAGAPRIGLTKPFVLVASEEQARADLQALKLDGYYVLPADFITSGRIDAFNRPTLGLTEGASNKMDELLKKALSQSLNDPALATRLQSPLKDISYYRLGNPQKLEETALIASFIVPLLVGMLIFVSLMTTSQFLMSGLVEEKENRMMEVFATSSRPSEMLWGKILGLGALGLTQMLIWAVFALGVAIVRGGVNFGQILSNLQITPDYLVIILIYSILGYLLFGTVMAGIGAASNAEQESRQVAGLLTIPALLPMMLSFSFIENPYGALPRFFSLFPITAPVGMILRASWSTVPIGDVIISLFLLILCIIGVVWISARVFRIGMLSYGKRLGVRDIIRAFREGRRSLVVTLTPTQRKPKGVRS